MKKKYQQDKYQASPSPLLLALIQRFVDIHYPKPVYNNPLNAVQPITHRG
jgi:hypothetical protein